VRTAVIGVALAGAVLLLSLRWNERRQFERSRRFDGALTHSDNQWKDSLMGFET
jgi:hypothetical protein